MLNGAFLGAYVTKYIPCLFLTFTSKKAVAYQRTTMACKSALIAEDDVFFMNCILFNEHRVC